MKKEKSIITCINCGNELKLNRNLLSQISIEAKEQVLNAERQKIKEEFQFEIAEKNLLINQIKEHLGLLQKKVEKQSQQHSGEAGEIVLEDILSDTFKTDEILPIGKGIKGGDVCLVIKDGEKNIGKVLYESKRTATFSADFISKAKSDQRECGADIAIIVTETFPKELGNRFGFKDGVYIIGFNDIKPVSIILRAAVIKLNELSSTYQNSLIKAEKLYNFLVSDSFRQEIEFLLDTFYEMQTDLEKEKRSISSTWSKRQHHIESALLTVTRFFGTIKGIAGNSIQNIEQLELLENKSSHEER